MRKGRASRLWLGVGVLVWMVLQVEDGWALEVDCRACDFCRGEPDLLAALDARIRAHLAAGRTAGKIAELEGGSMVRPTIELWANKQPGAVKPDRKRLKYRGSFLPDGMLFSSFEPCVLLNGVCVGTDKLGHFFQQGWEYFEIAVTLGKGEAVARRYGEWLEGLEPRESYGAVEEEFFRTHKSGKMFGYGGFGRTMSGVMSRADLAANLAGLRFYQDVAAGKFRGMGAYVSTNWCEEVNTNLYTREMAAIVGRNGSSLFPMGE
jgi:hypothetical protein